MRDTFTRTLLQIARTDPRVILMTGDLGFGVLTPFAQELPNQFINVGVAEQNLTGLATGLAMSGQVVFTYSIGNFPTLRCLEQIRNDACYHNANVKIVSIGAGFSYGALGISHHATEDLAILRSLPDLQVVSPGDCDEAEAATHGLYQTPGCCYLRLDKSAAPAVSGADPVAVPGSIRRLIAGETVVILGTGGVLAEAVEASRQLAAYHIDCGVYSVHTVSPLDTAGVRRAVGNASCVLTLEEHTINGGLGSAVAEVIADHGLRPKHFRRLGLRGFSSIVGSQQFLRAQYGLDSKTIVSTIVSLCR